MLIQSSFILLLSGEMNVNYFLFIKIKAARLLLCPVFCFCSHAFYIVRLWGRIYACGGGKKDKYFAFLPKFVPFYGYWAAIRHAGAAQKRSYLLFQASNLHFTPSGPYLGLRGRLLSPVFCFFRERIFHFRVWGRCLACGAAFETGIWHFQASNFRFRLSVRNLSLRGWFLRSIFCFSIMYRSSFYTGTFLSIAFGESSMLLDNAAANKTKAKQH